MATKVKKPSKRKPVKAMKTKAKKIVKTAKKAVKPAKAKIMKTAKKKPAIKSKKKPILKKTIKKAAPAKPKKIQKTKISPKRAAPKKAVPRSSAKVSPRSAFKPKTQKAVQAGPISTFLISGEIAPYKETAGEQYMNEKQREHFRKILLHRKRQIMLEMDRTVHHLQDEPVNLPDPNDRASQEEEFSLELRARDRERKFIKNIEDALQRLDEGIYGECESCGVEIGIRRLEARPTATLCIDCKTLDEIREKQMGG